MKVVIFGSDPTTCSDTSATFLRLYQYAAHFETLHAFSLVRTRTAVGCATRGGCVGECIYWPRAFYSFRVWSTCARADVISAQDPFFTGFLALFFATLLRKPLHVQVHTDPFAAPFARTHRFNTVRLSLARMVLRCATRIRVVSEKVKDDLVARGIRVPITVLPIFVDRDAFTHIERKKHPEWKIALVCVGRLEAEKGFNEAIRAVAVLRAHNHDAGLTIVGDGSMREQLAKEATQARIERFVKFVGAQKDIVPYLETADAVLVPSAYEGYGLVIIEALSARVPVIAYDVGVARESGAIIAPRGEFTETVLSWAAHGPRVAELLGYPYTNRDDYVQAWARDIHECV